jgi:hypothetical protein
MHTSRRIRAFRRFLGPCLGRGAHFTASSVLLSPLGSSRLAGGTRGLRAATKRALGAVGIETRQAGARVLQAFDNACTSLMPISRSDGYGHTKAVLSKTSLPGIDGRRHRCARFNNCCGPRDPTHMSLRFRGKFIPMRRGVVRSWTYRSGTIIPRANGALHGCDRSSYPEPSDTTPEISLAASPRSGCLGTSWS